jgi:5-methyltetrahydropteroyltriglutamate--homocysteine methyltransferase
MTSGARSVPLLATTLIGSYPQPDWLIDRDRLRSSLPARVRAKELWRIPEPFLQQAQDDATALAILDFERAGVDILTDGEIRRESYSNRFATSLEGMDIANPAIVPGRAGGANAVPRVVGPVRRTRPVEVDDLRFLRAQTDRAIRITLPGPFTMSQQAHNEAYPDVASLAMDLAAAVNEELHELFAAGADIVQLDEPWLQARAEQAREYALPAIDRALRGARGTTALHTCFGYAHVVRDRPPGCPFLAELADCAADQLAVEAAQPRLDPSVLARIAGKTIIVGVLDLSDDAAVETPEQVAERIERMLPVIPAERLQVGPDCGMKYLSREVAFAKLRALVDGAALVRGRLQPDDPRGDLAQRRTPHAARVDERA